MIDPLSGKLIVAGFVYTPKPPGTPWDRDFLVARYTPDGTLDGSFGTNGFTATGFNGGQDFAYGVALQADGKVVVAGWAAVDSSNNGSQFALARYLGDGSPLLAAALPATTSNTALTAAQLQPIVAAAAARWQAAGANGSPLTNLDLRIADLGGATLGMASGRTVWLDATAAGWGWFVDPTPSDDREFTTPGDQGEQDHMDLLTVVMHEMGHVLGLDHDADGVMQKTLPTGTRRLPTAEEGPAVALPLVDTSAAALSASLPARHAAATKAYDRVFVPAAWDWLADRDALALALTLEGDRKHRR